MSKKTRQIINILLVAVLIVSLSLFGRSVVVNHRTQNRYDNVRSLVTSDNTAGNISDSGDTTSDETLRRLAVEAACKAKFKPSQRTAQGGRITYDFKLQ